MKLDNQRILELFAIFADIDDPELENWRGLCAAASGAIAGRIRPGVDIRRHMERLCTAAAAFAYADYLMLSTGGTKAANEIRVGDISLKKSAGISGDEREASELRVYFLEQIADLLEAPAGFAFVAAGETI